MRWRSIAEETRSAFVDRGGASSWVQRGAGAGAGRRRLAHGGEGLREYSVQRLSADDRANVSTLTVAFTFPTGVQKGHEAAPIVAGDTMFVVTPFPNILYALDWRGAVR